MNEEAFRAWVANKINHKSFNGHWDHTRAIRVLGREVGKRDRETWIEGTTGAAQIEVSMEGEGFDAIFVARITLPVQSHYRRKTFIGVGYEWRGEDWDTTYNYKATYRRGILTNRISDEQFLDHSTASDHDAVQWSHDELRNDVITRLTAPE